MNTDLDKCMVTKWSTKQGQQEAKDLEQLKGQVNVEHLTKVNKKQK